LIRRPPKVKDDRLRIPIDPSYIASLGLATYAFAELEWSAVWCCERMCPGIVNSLDDKTAGGVAKKLVELATLRHATVNDDLLPAAKEFQGLVLARNALMHAKPGTDTDDEQRLFRNGHPWKIERINDLADEFTACSIRLNDLLHGVLHKP
jgi:hypothetical protein